MSGAGIACWQSAGLVIERLRVWIPAGAVGEFSLAEQLCTDLGLKSGLSVRELISTLKKKYAGGEWMVEHSPEILASEEKATTTRNVDEKNHNVLLLCYDYTMMITIINNNTERMNCKFKNKNKTNKQKTQQNQSLTLLVGRCSRMCVPTR